MDSLYTALSYVGLNTMLRRFIFAFVSVAALEYWFKPWYAFDEEGGFRPWVVTNPDSDNVTWLPFLAFPIVAGILFGFFV